MVLLQRLLLLPLLAPLLLVLLVGALNPRPSLALRLLVWTSPALPIGLWIALAAGGGAGLSATAATLALRSGPMALRRQVRRPAEAAPGNDWAAGPERAPGEPAPTVAVPFRVIRRGRSQEPVPAAAPATATATANVQATAVGDGWDTPVSDDW